MRFFFLFLFLTQASSLFGQYHFSGQVSAENNGNSIYLSLVEDYRKSGRVYLDQIVQKSEVDSLGHFSFEGNNLNDQNRIYRIHLDGCSDNTAAITFWADAITVKMCCLLPIIKIPLAFPPLLRTNRFAPYLPLIQNPGSYWKLMA